MIYEDTSNKKICLQNIIVNQKKFKNIMYSSESLVGNPNYLRTRTLTNEIDILLNIGSCKFVYLRFQRTNLEWHNEIREKHLMYSVYSQSDSLNKVCVDFQFEVCPKDERSSKICFLFRSSSFYMINICSLYFCPEANSYKIKPFREISAFTSPLIYSSLLLNFQQMFVMLAGLGYSGFSNLGEDKVLIKFFTKLNIAKVDILAEDEKVLDTQVALPYTKEVVFLKKGENSENLDHEEITKRLESIQIKNIITHVNQGDPTTSAPSFTSSLYVVGEESMLLQPLQLMPATQRVGEISLEGLQLVDSRLIPSEWNKLRRTYITSLSVKKDSELPSGLASVSLAVSNGIIATLRMKAPRSF